MLKLTGENFVLTEEYKQNHNITSNIQRGVTGTQNLFHHLLFVVPVEI